jgi:hypothetical protein
MRTSVLHTVLAVALVVGMAACKGPDTLDDTNFFNFSWVGRGANVLPRDTITADTTGGADTLPTASATMVANSDTAVGTITWNYTAGATAPLGVIDSLLIFTANSAAAIVGATPTAILCNSTATCTASGTSLKVSPGTAFAALRTSMRAYGTQLVVCTTVKHKIAVSPQLGGCAIRGVIFKTP